MRKTLFGMLAALTILSTAAPASADYVCDWYMSLGSTSMGASGHLRLTTYTEPSCAGTLTGIWYVCSESATNGNCATGTANVYSDSDLNAVFSAITQAGLWGMKVTVTSNPCIGGGSGCAGYLKFRAYGG